MSYIFDNNFSLIYLLTDRNQIFRYTINHSNADFKLDEKHIYGFHAYNILSIGFCAHKSWLITFGADNLVKILDYNDMDREIISRYIPDNAHALAGRNTPIKTTFLFVRIKDLIHMVFIYVWQ